MGSDVFASVHASHLINTWTVHERYHRNVCCCILGRKALMLVALSFRWRWVGGMSVSELATTFHPCSTDRTQHLVNACMHTLTAVSAARPAESGEWPCAVSRQLLRALSLPEICCKLSHPECSAETAVSMHQTAGSGRMLDSALCPKLKQECTSPCR